MPPIRVLLVDDHPVVRLGIRHLIETQTDITVIGEAGDGFEAIRLINELQPDIILLDMEMPGMNGSDVVQRLHDDGSKVPVLALSAHDDRQYIQELLKNGAAGYLVKEELPGTLTDAIRGVARGEQGWVSRRVAAQMTTWIKEEEPPAVRELTPRETDVLREIIQGKTNQEIALSLKISEKTVEKHLRGVFGKLGVETRVEAAVLAIRLGLLKDKIPSNP